MNKDNKKIRPPVVVVLGHVDHGKTSILDYIRKSKVAEGESGGITQHMGAYQVEQSGKLITFIDTPGHEAFSAMRSRGVNVADIAILVVAADDAVMPQTKESIKTLKSSGIPYITVLTKSDVSDKNVEKVKGQLLKEEVLLEGQGGDVPVIEVSAKTNENIKELLDLIVFFTIVGAKQVQAWPIKRGKTAIEAAENVHSDFARGFIVAEVINWKNLVETGSWHVAKEKGLVKTAGRDEVIEDGQVVEFKFTQ